MTGPQPPSDVSAATAADRRKVPVAVLISGRGSNMMSLVEAAAAPDYPARIAVVISNRPQAPGLAWARERGLDAVAMDHKAYASREAFDAALHQAILDAGAEIVACAGFMRLMTPILIEPWRDRMINIHPSLLPLFKGLRTHEQAIAAGMRVAGCTVHIVRHEMDTGPILGQAVVPVVDGDTPESLARRVLSAEHELYPRTLAHFAAGNYEIDGELARLRVPQISEDRLLSPKV